MNIQELQAQIARCRRLALQVSDVQTRLSLEALADEYEAQLSQSDDEDDEPPFMLRTRH